MYETPERLGGITHSYIRDFDEAQKGFSLGSFVVSLLKNTPLFNPHGEGKNHELR